MLRRIVRPRVVILLLAVLLAQFTGLISAHAAFLYGIVACLVALKRPPVRKRLEQRAVRVWGISPTPQQYMVYLDSNSDEPVVREVKEAPRRRTGIRF